MNIQSSSISAFICFSIKVFSCLIGAGEGRFPGTIENTTLLLKKLGLVPPYTNQYLISNMFVYVITDDKQINKRLLHDNFPLIL